MKSFALSPELLTGLGLVAAGFGALACGIQDTLSPILAAFGGGLILSDAAARLSKAARARVKVRVRRDDE